MDAEDPGLEPLNELMLKLRAEAEKLLSQRSKTAEAVLEMLDSHLRQPSAPADALALLQQAHEALRYHTEQTRPVANSEGTMRCIEIYLADARASVQPSAPSVEPAEQPALDWPQMLLLINAYASHMADAAQHQAASRADISHAAALKALADIRMAMAAHTSRWQALVHELIWRAAPQAAPAPQASAPSEEPADPMDWPLPCAVKVGHGTHGKGTPLRSLVRRMQLLYDMAQEATTAGVKLAPQAAPAQADIALALAAAKQSCRRPGEPEAGWCLIDPRHVETLCRAAQAASAQTEHAPTAQPATVPVAREYTPDSRTLSQKLAEAGFTRRPSLTAMEMREALELIAAPMRPDGTWNRDREACRELAAEVLGRYDDSNPPNAKLSGGPAGRTE